MVAAAIQRYVQPLGANRDLFLVSAVIGILLAIVLPLPTGLMDALLALNITFSLLILLTAIYMKSPLDFSVFPSVLLVMTLYRLALNIATTRLILGNAGEEEAFAAGQVIHVFGNTVAAGNAVVGFVIFVVIVIIQFVVITKGATRIAEVAARFTLDKMPGQQLSIDADLNAGLIDEQTAKERRETINQEADFYGAMDGASKFVRGDAIAGILITVINLIGGLVIGMTSYGMEWTKAIEVFSMLTIGDGLVSQIPALIVSVGAALIVTRQTGTSNLGADLINQVFSSPRAVAITSVFLLLLIPLGLPPFFLLLCAATLGLVAFMGAAKAPAGGAEVDGAEEEDAPLPESPTEMALPPVDPLELEVGYGLVNLVDSGDGGGLLQRVALIREQVAAELGIVVPPVRIRDNMQFRPSDYAIKLRGETVASGSLMVDHYLAMESGVDLEPIDGIPTKEPAFGIDAAWISEENKGRAEALGYTVVDLVSVLATHLTEIIRDHAAELLTRSETKQLIDKLKESAAPVVDEVVPDPLKVGDVQKVLQNLLREKVSIRDLEAIFESLADWAPRTKDVEVLTEYARHGLSRSICRQYGDDDGRVHVVTLDPRLEEFVENGIEHTERGSFLRLSPEMIAPIVESVSTALERLLEQGHPPIVLASPQIRLQIRRLLETQVPGVVVLSFNEVAKGVSVESAGVAVIQ